MTSGSFGGWVGFKGDLYEIDSSPFKLINIDIFNAST
jgi:hypothetical protein